MITIIPSTTKLQANLFPGRNFAKIIPPVVFLNWLAGGGGAPVWWHEIPTPAYAPHSPRTPAAHLRDRPEIRRKMRKYRRTRRVVEVAESVRLEEEHVGALLDHQRARLAALVRWHRRQQVRERQRRTVPSRIQRMVESDEEFLIITGRL